MGRKSNYTQKVLNDWLNKYLMERCSSNILALSIPKFGQYLRENDINIADYTLRRNVILREKIEEYKKNFKSNVEEIVMAYKTLDVDLFLETNTSKGALKEALIALDNTYNQAMLAAMNLVNENKVLKQKNHRLHENIEKLENERKKFEIDLSEKKKQNVKLVQENQKLKRLINDYVYPEIANELLKKEGIILETANFIKKESIEQSLVRENTDIERETLKNIFVQHLLEDI